MKQPQWPLFSLLLLLLGAWPGTALAQHPVLWAESHKEVEDAEADQLFELG